MAFLRTLAVAATAAIAALIGPLPAQAGYGDRPGDFDYYALVLSWSPSFCLSGDGAHANDPQCSSTRPYAFVLHGLWPQFDKGWPESCATGGDTTVPPQLVNAMLDIMPSEHLVTHEFEKHGTCSGLDANGYFKLARQLYGSINVLPKYIDLAAPLQVSVDELRNDLLKANPRLGPGMLAVDCEKSGRLREVHICFGKDGAPVNCGHNEVQAKMCRTDVVTLPPVRGGGLGAAGGATEQPKQSAPATSAANGAATDNASGAANDNGASDGSTTRHHRRHHKKHWYDNFSQHGPATAPAVSN